MRQCLIIWLLCILLLAIAAESAMAQETDPVWSERCGTDQRKTECRLREPQTSFNACFPIAYVQCCGCNADYSRCYACPNTSSCAKEACLDPTPLEPRSKGSSSFKTLIRTEPQFSAPHSSLRLSIGDYSNAHLICFLLVPVYVAVPFAVAGTQPISHVPPK